MILNRSLLTQQQIANALFWISAINLNFKICECTLLPQGLQRIFSIKIPTTRTINHDFQLFKVD